MLSPAYGQRRCPDCYRFDVGIDELFTDGCVYIYIFGDHIFHSHVPARDGR